MSNLINCPDCGKEISLRALACPNCRAPGRASIPATIPIPPVLQTISKPERVVGPSKPAPAIRTSLWKRQFNGIHAAGVFFFIIIPIALLIDRVVRDRPRNEEPVSSRQISPDGFMPSSGNIVPGRQVYIHDNKTLVGTIKDVRSSHFFGDGTTRDAVLIQFKDGSEDWMPRDAVKKLYVVKSP